MRASFREALGLSTASGCEALLTLASLPILLAGLAACGNISATPSPACLRTDAPSADTTVYALDSVDVKPRSPQGKVMAPPPEVLLSQSRGPNVDAEAIVETTGYVSERSIVLRHVESAEMAATATQVIKNALYCPAIRHGVPVRSRIHLRFYIVIERSG